MNTKKIAMISAVGLMLTSSITISLINTTPIQAKKNNHNKYLHQILKREFYSPYKEEGLHKINYKGPKPNPTAEKLMNTLTKFAVIDKKKNNHYAVIIANKDTIAYSYTSNIMDPNTPVFEVKDGKVITKVIKPYINKEHKVDPLTIKKGERIILSNPFIRAIPNKSYNQKIFDGKPIIYSFTTDKFIAKNSLEEATSPLMLDPNDFEFTKITKQDIKEYRKSKM